MRIIDFVNWMSHAHGVDLLHGEEADVIGKPHPLSFLRYHLFAAYLIGVAMFLGWFDSYIRSNEAFLGVLSFLDIGISGIEPPDVIILIFFWIILLLSGFGIGVLWVSKMPLVYMVLVGTAGTVLDVYLLERVPMVKLLFLGATAILGMILTEVYRRGHVHIITNYRIITKKRFVLKEERELMFDKITDVYVSQGILGRIFNFGTVIPISASGFGLGADSAQAFTAAGVSIKKGMFSGGFGGGKSVWRPRSATYFSLHGISNPRKIRIIIGNRQLETKEAPILRRIEGLLKDKETKKDGFDEATI